jgi:hypothetical protein
LTTRAKGRASNEDARSAFHCAVVARLWAVHNGETTEEMTHRSKEGVATKDAGGSRAVPEVLKGIAEGAASEQEPKKPKSSEEKEGKAAPARALAKSGGGSLATPASLAREGPNLHITTTTSTSMAAVNFKPVLPPELADSSIERSVDDDCRRPGRRDRRFCGCNASASKSLIKRVCSPSATRTCKVKRN